ncbi:MAG: hypothetical protein IKQ44_14630 [Lachnospiraceae bacterium]|nr:hypothetical protein [Lachnospiraceae bacterium]
MMYYESDFRMAGGEIELLYKEHSYLIFSDYIARITIQGMSILVSMRVYPKGYGKIMSLVEDESRTDKECIKTRKMIDEYFAVCNAFDAYYLRSNYGARLGLEVRYGRLTILSLFLSLLFMWRAVTGLSMTLNGICALICLGLAGAAEIIKDYKVRNHVLNQEIMDEIVANGKLVGMDKDGKTPIYAIRSYRSYKAK